MCPQLGVASVYLLSYSGMYIFMLSAAKAELVSKLSCRAEAYLQSYMIHVELIPSPLHLKGTLASGREVQFLSIFKQL